MRGPIFRHETVDGLTRKRANRFHSKQQQAMRLSSRFTYEEPVAKEKSNYETPHRRVCLEDCLIGESVGISSHIVCDGCDLLRVIPGEGQRPRTRNHFTR